MESSLHESPLFRTNEAFTTSAREQSDHNNQIDKSSNDHISKLTHEPTLMMKIKTKHKIV